jgi:hypothetical protein
MTIYSRPGADTRPHPHPERTAGRRASSDPMNFDVIYQVWSNRAAMAHTIRMQQKRESRPDDWRPVVPLKVGEGY